MLKILQFFVTKTSSYLYIRFFVTSLSSFYARKAKKLAELEEKWQASQATSKSFYAIWRSYSSSIVTNIVENLQVSCANLFKLSLAMAKFVLV